MNDFQFGFQPGDLELLVQVLAAFPEVEKAVIFGSRAKGNNKPGSDVDLALWLSGQDVTGQIVGKLNDETLMPYKFEVVNYRTISNKNLSEHIDRAGKVVYKKS